jgi:ATP/maltotriose-dependent transcriptional regulator MalT
LFERATGIGTRVGDPDLVALGLLGRGQALVRTGRIADGVALLDEVMVAVTADEVGATTAGIAYCAVIEACQSIYDATRAREWTEALTRWCAAQPELVPYRGQCLVYRAEIKQRQGAWDEALTELQSACTVLSEPRVHPALGLAFYRLGELHRVAGQLDEARAAYRRADELGHDPEPGPALLLRDRGDDAAALHSIQASLVAVADPVARLPLLAAAVEIALSAGDPATARSSADELTRLISDLGTGSDLLAAVADQADGAVRLAEGDARGAVVLLRRALDGWRSLEAPYDAAHARLLLGKAYRELGDEATAEDERQAALDVLGRLGAAPDPHLDDGGDSPWHLTAREREVLVLVARGQTNRQIAESLTISEHTARRHIQNICGKLDVPSRTAATALAIREGLV